MLRTGPHIPYKQASHFLASEECSQCRLLKTFHRGSQNVPWIHNSLPDCSLQSCCPSDTNPTSSSISMNLSQKDPRLSSFTVKPKPTEQFIHELSTPLSGNIKAILADGACTWCPWFPGWPEHPGNVSLEGSTEVSTHHRQGARQRQQEMSLYCCRPGR